MSLPLLSKFTAEADSDLMLYAAFRTRSGDWSSDVHRVTGLHQSLLLALLMSKHAHIPTDNGYNTQPDEQSPNVWELHHAYLFAPPKPDGDIWHSVLEPMIKKDKMRCDAWKDEVQNLLIFAGLFSAVVTAFVIESYKNLQPDPLENLVLVITASRDNLNSSTVLVSPFSPTASSIRVNIFWFTSLVLSLTTVLVGIVSLQWLREHQSYPDLTPKQIFALFHMRSEGLEKWRVPQIFATLPLLLQAALVLFFAGMIDFLFALQPNVAIPIVIIIGLSLIFLVATTILPTLQGFPFYFPFLYLGKNPPSQCAYKSPQSQAFRAISKAAFRTLSFLLYTLPRKRPFNDHHIIPSIASTWSQGTWTHFDLAWLTIRDAYMQGIHDRKPDLPLHRRRWSSDLPLYDIAKGLREVVQNEEHGALQADHFLSAVYYCFEEVSLDIMGRSKCWNDPTNGFGNQERRNAYFRQIVEEDEAHLSQGRYRRNQRSNRPTSSISDFLHLNDGWGLRGWEAWEVLHHENMLIFLSQVILKRHTSAMFSTHVMELQMRMVRDLLGKPRKLRRNWTGNIDFVDANDTHSPLGQRANPVARLPPSLIMDYTGFKEILLKHISPGFRSAFGYQYANVIKSFFLAVADAAPIDSDRHDQSSATLHTHPHMLSLVTEAGWITSYLMETYASAGKLNMDGEPETMAGLQASLDHNAQARHMIKVFSSNFAFIVERLEMETREIGTELGAEIGTMDKSRPTSATFIDFSFHHSTAAVNPGDPHAAYSSLPQVSHAYASDSPSRQNASLLFYVTSLYIQALTQQHHEAHSPIRKVLDDLIPVMRRYYYKRRMHSKTAITSRRVHTAISLSPGDTSPSRVGTRNDMLEKKWGGVDEYGVERFSEKWWEFLIGAGVSRGP